jgi:hypothetical protein
MIDRSKPLPIHEFPKVSKATLKTKMQVGLAANQWQIVGRGGTWEAAIGPIVEYLRKRGVEVV